MFRPYRAIIRLIKYTISSLLANATAVSCSFIKFSCFCFCSCGNTSPTSRLHPPWFASQHPNCLLPQPCLPPVMWWRHWQTVQFIVCTGIHLNRWGARRYEWLETSLAAPPLCIIRHLHLYIFWCLCHARCVGRDSSVGIATCYGLDGPGMESWLRQEFPHCPDQPAIQAVPGLSPGGGLKHLGRGIDHPPPSSAKVKEKVELYLYSPSGTLWPVIVWTVPLLFTFVLRGAFTS